MIYDLIIVGSGAAGLSAAVYASRAMLNFAVVEKEFEGTGQIAETERVDNYLGLNGISGYELGEKFREHAKALGTEFIGGEANEIQHTESGFITVLSDGGEIRSKTVIYAAGAAHRKLGIAGESEFSGRGVSYCATCDGMFYKDKTAAVIGGGDTAFSDALTLSKIAQKVFLIHRRDVFRASKILQKRAEETPNIEFVKSAVPVEILGDKKVNSLKINQRGEEKILNINGIFVAAGIIPNTAPLKTLGVLDHDNYVIADEDGITKTAGFFAAGDVRTKKLRQVITAAADGANCVRSAEEYLEKC